jgi:hypothetical protein
MVAERDLNTIARYAGAPPKKFRADKALFRVASAVREGSMSVRFVHEFLKTI